MFLFGGLTLPLGWAPQHWHTHELLYGFVPAVIAGFMLTAMTNWTGAAPLKNSGLLALVLLWLAGRVVMCLAGWLPPVFVALVDLAFLPVLAIYVFQTLWRYNSRRNLVLVFLLTLLFLGNVVMHTGFVTAQIQWLQKGQLMGLNIIALLIAIIAGRITPEFSGNWLRKQGREVLIKCWLIIEIPAFCALVALLVADIVSAPQILIAWFALAAAVLHAVRLFGWRGWQFWREPLLWVLHLAYFWLVCAFGLRAVSFFIESFDNSVWQHAMGIGAIGTIIWGVMTRVAVGHTGRPLKLPSWGVGIYWLITLATVLRILVAFGWCDFCIGINISAGAWVLAFSLFVVLYGPVLASPHPDGKPG